MTTKQLSKLISEEEVKFIVPMNQRGVMIQNGAVLIGDTTNIPTECYIIESTDTTVTIMPTTFKGYRSTLDLKHLAQMISDEHVLVGNYSGTSKEKSA